MLNQVNNSKNSKKNYESAEYGFQMKVPDVILRHRRLNIGFLLSLSNCCYLITHIRGVTDTSIFTRKQTAYLAFRTVTLHRTQRPDSFACNNHTINSCSQQENPHQRQDAKKSHCHMQMSHSFIASNHV